VLIGQKCKVRCLSRSKSVSHSSEVMQIINFRRVASRFKDFSRKWHLLFFYHALTHTQLRVVFMTPPEKPSVSHSSVERVPPQALDVERTVLGSMLIDKNATATVFELLQENAFYSGANRKIFECMRTLFEQNVPIDVITLDAELQRRSWLDAVGDLLTSVSWPKVSPLPRMWNTMRRFCGKRRPCGSSSPQPLLLRPTALTTRLKRRNCSTGRNQRFSAFLNRGLKTALRASGSSFPGRSRRSRIFIPRGVSKGCSRGLQSSTR
jgi:hypothetical protein